MGIVIEREDGMEYTLPDALALDGAELAIETPGMEIPRRHGQWKFDKERSAAPRELRLSGTFRQVDRNAADAFANQLTSILFGGGELKLRRRPTSPLYIRCTPRSIEWDHRRGYFGGAAFSLNLVFEAQDPWWYDVTGVSALRVTGASGEEWTVNHPGTDQRQPVLVRISAVSGILVNPTVAIAAVPGGAAFATGSYTGTVDTNHVLVIDGLTRKAWLEDWTGALLGGADSGPVAVQNVTNSMGAQFQAEGLFLRAGANTLRYTDDAASSHQARVCAEFVPRSW